MNVNYKNSPETGEKIGPNNIEDRLQYIYLLNVQMYIRYKKIVEEEIQKNNQTLNFFCNYFLQIRVQLFV